MPPELEPSAPTVALLPWGDVIEDFLDPIGVSTEGFLEEMSGGWMFGYVEALARAGVRTALVCVSRSVHRPTRRVHRPTGAAAWLLPPLRSYRRLHRRRHLAPYLATPPRALAGALRAERSAVILCQEYEEARFDVAVAVGHRLGLPVFATFQGGDQHRSLLERFVRPLSLRAGAGLIVAASSERRRLERRYRLPSGKVSAVPNPLDLDLWPVGDRADARRRLGIPGDARVVVWHGRVEMHRKGLDVLVDAWAQICAAHPTEDVRLLMVGDGADREALHRRLDAEAIRGVRWLDSYLLDRSELRPYLDAADVYVLPSRHEGLPVAPLEAMACRLPVVAADAPGVVDTLPAGEADGGVVVPRGDPVALAAALEGLLDDPVRSCALGTRGRRRVEETFSLPVVGRQLRQVLLRDTGPVPAEPGCAP